MASTVEDYKKRMEFVYSLIGNKCILCGSGEYIHAHHVRDKSFTIGKKWSCSEKVLVDEVKKCVILCKNCHIAIHKKPHGTEARYRHSKCRCEKCKEAHRLHTKAYREKREIREPGFRTKN